ncbi:ATP-binding protein [Candidatus Woesearchaeota archaeon]|nr:ATP-binding protein [Candidatus Woesearchaeota archaeon]
MFLKFINRKAELEFLEARYKNKQFEFIVIYGRRRLGKTELIKEFVKNKKHIYFLCDKRGTAGNIARFKKMAAEYFNEAAIETNEPEEVFKHIVKKQSDKLVIVFDEFSYLAEKDSSIPSIFQLIIDEVLKDSNIMLILCGSSINMMETGVLSYKSPLYGRKTGHWKVLPFTLKETSEFFANNTTSKNIEFWAVLDGIPFYLEKFSDKKSTLENVEAEILNKNGRLYEEIDFVLKEELREPDAYKSILEAIASGKNKVVEIANKAGIKVQDIDKYLKILIRLGIIKKEHPATEKAKTKKSIYSFADNFFHFWFEFCEPYKSSIEINEYAISKVKDDINSFFGKKFENLCRDILIEITKLNFTKVGKWWGSNRENDERKSIEIDILALNEQTKEILFGECKWSENVDAQTIFDQLKQKSKHVNWNISKRQEYYCVIAKSFKRKAEGCLCFDLNDIESLL